jgi:hypothetical protein
MVYAIPILTALHPKSSYAALTDLKTVLTSAWCLAHRTNAYDLSNIRAMFVQAGIVVPGSWFGRAPVYPPVTLMLFFPVTWISLVHALFLLEGLWLAFLAVAVAVLMRYAGSRFGVSLPGRAVLAICFVASPYLLAALILGNLCIPAICLAICAFVLREHRWPWLPAAALALAIALKPHATFWVLLPLLLLPGPHSRRVAARAVLMLAALSLLTIVWLAGTHQLRLQAHGYRTVMASETAGNASMSSATHEVSALAIQITSLQSLIGFWHAPGAAAALVCSGILLACAIAALIFTRRVRNERAALLSMLAWAAFGLSATYHRAYDGLLVLAVLPYLLACLAAKEQRWKGAALAVLLIAMSYGPALTTVNALTQDGHTITLASFLLMRQAALADLGMVFLLLFLLWREVRDEGHQEAAETSPSPLGEHA